jgi:hypothetical protein
MKKELIRMPDIYKGSYVTISAASAKTSSAGFLEPRNPEGQRMVRLAYRCPDGVLGNVFLFKHKYSEPSSPIDARAWTFQESLLSPRIVEFGAETLRWKCYGLGEAYGGTNETNRKTSWPESSIKKAMDEWGFTVSKYSCRQMSKEDDRLVAISAIAADFGETVSRKFGSKKAEYAAGLWASDLEYQLLWSTHYDETVLPRPKEYQAPTWSWASMKGGVSFPVRENLRLKIWVWNVQVDLKSPDLRYGQVKGGEVMVRGRLRSAIWMPGQRQDSLEDPTVAELKGGKLASARRDAEGDLKIPGSTVWCLECGTEVPSSGAFGSSGSSEHWGIGVSTIVGLILCPCRWEDLPESARADEKNHPTFRRVGYFELKYDGYDTSVSREWHVQNNAKKNWFQDCEEQTIRLL